VSQVCGVPRLMVQMPVTWRLEMAVHAARDILGYRPEHDYRGMVTAGREASTDVIPVQV
jgi:hypothetical protein